MLIDIVKNLMELNTLTIISTKNVAATIVMRTLLRKWRTGIMSCHGIMWIKRRFYRDKYLLDRMWVQYGI